MKGRRAFAASVGVALLSASAAEAATVAVRTDLGPAGPNGLAVIAAPGERNEIVLRFVVDVAAGPASAYWAVSDSGSVLVPGESCAASDPHTVRCQLVGFAPGTGGAIVELGDMDDSIAIEGTPGGTVEGGAGNDTIVGASTISGGPGDDELVEHPYGNRLGGYYVGGHSLRWSIRLEVPG
jgi:Ca2+-binding RTX toxin-like protein